MSNQNTLFDRIEFIQQFSTAISQIETANRLGEDFASQGIKRFFFVGCGAPYYMMRLVAYWGKKSSIATDIRVFSAPDLINQDPLSMDDKTLVIFCSHSGTTKETLQAAAFLQSKPCKTLAITQELTSPLGKLAQNTLPYGKTAQGYFSSFILAQTLFSAYLNERELGWGYHPSLMESLPNFPAALADAKESSLALAKTQADGLMDQGLIYILGSGPMFTTAYVFAACFLMEMQWIHAHALKIPDFFHGPFEVVDKTVPLIVLIGEDMGRSEGERAKRFCSQYAGNTYVYDAREFDMNGINATIRPIVAPFILDSALTNLVEQLAEIRDHPMTSRRYMGKVKY
jgi:fructoselysine 6-phosphate deglycase